MSTGTVKWFNSQKGYGFIRPDSGGAEYFVHVGSMLDRDAWVEGEPVTFVPGEAKPDSRKAPPAYSVRSARTKEV